jgi:adenylate cyclase
MMVVGKGAGLQMLLVTMSIAPFVLYPRTRRRHAFVASALGLLLWAIAEQLGPEQPIVGALPAPGDVQQAYIASLIAIYVLLGVLGFIAVRYTDAAELDAESERNRAERLLRSVLPEAIVERLKTAPGTIADAFDEVTVLFADIVGFTALAQTMSASELVTLLDDVFRRFDDMADERGLEKIKTIGDAYMVASGVPGARHDHADAIADLALGMVGAVNEVARARSLELDIRIGIASGPVVAGVIGRHRFIYDLWGDTVNTASRMESHGKPGRVQLTEETRRRLSPRFVVELRGEVEVKGKGMMTTWWLSRRFAPGASVPSGTKASAGSTTANPI